MTKNIDLGRRKAWIIVGIIICISIAKLWVAYNSTLGVRQLPIIQCLANTIWIGVLFYCSDHLRKRYTVFILLGFATADVLFGSYLLLTGYVLLAFLRTLMGTAYAYCIVNVLSNEPMQYYLDSWRNKTPSLID